MTIFRLVLLISLVAVTAQAQQNSPQRRSVPASCPVTAPPASPFTPPAAYELGRLSFWWGTEKLWTVLRKSGVRGWSPSDPGRERRAQPLGEKTFWMSVDYDFHKEEDPDLKVTGRRLDGDAPALLTLDASNAFPGPASAMLVGIYVPTPGCWEITGEYHHQKLSYVVWVTPAKEASPDK